MKFLRSKEPDWSFFFSSLSSSELAEFELMLVNRELYLGEYMELIEQSFLKENRRFDFKTHLWRQGAAKRRAFIFAHPVVAVYSANKKVLGGVSRLKQSLQPWHSPEIPVDPPRSESMQSAAAWRLLRIKSHNHARIREIRRSRR